MRTGPCTHSCSRAASAALRRLRTALEPGRAHARMLRREYLCTAAHAGAQIDVFVTQNPTPAGGGRGAGASRTHLGAELLELRQRHRAPEACDDARGAGGSPAPSQGPLVRGARMRACVQAGTHACGMPASTRGTSIPSHTHSACIFACQHTYTHTLHAYLRSPRRGIRESAPRTGFRPRPHGRRRWTLAARSCGSLCVISVSRS